MSVCVCVCVCVCVFSESLYVTMCAYIFPRNYVWVYTHAHTHTLSRTLGMVSGKRLWVLSDMPHPNLPGGLLTALSFDTKGTAKAAPGSRRETKARTDCTACEMLWMLRVKGFSKRLCAIFSTQANRSKKHSLKAQVSGILRLWSHV